MAYTRQQAGIDMVKFIEMAEEAEAAGNHTLAGIWRVEAHNCIGRIGMKNVHKNNLGPYTPANPMHCVYCGKAGEKWVKGEECIPTGSPAS